jgi:nucleotide-binding universal stress UspA family protein
MKFKPSSKSGRVVLELGTEEAKLPTTLPELKLTRILVPVDFSESSRKALHYGVTFARQFDAEILLLHAVELPIPAPESILIDQDLVNADLEKAAKARLSEWSKQLAAPVSVKTKVRVGNPYFEIVEEAKRRNVDLIAIGTRGRAGLLHALIGSTAERVVRHASCPVMVVREREHDFVETVESSRRPENYDRSAA